MKTNNRKANKTQEQESREEGTQRCMVCTRVGLGGIGAYRGEEARRRRCKEVKEQSDKKAQRNGSAELWNQET